MIPMHSTDSRCGSCGADLPLVGAPCSACLPAVAVEESVGDEALVLAETVEVVACEAAETDECVRTPLWLRLSVASVYLVVAVACAYGSRGFFDGNFMTSSDWIFGAMAIGLALIALLGVKESLFPTDWKPE